MAKTFNSLAELKSYIESQHRQCTQEIGRVGEKTMKEVTQKNLYDDYSPERYVRTKDMINKIKATKSDKNSVEIEIGQGGHRSWAKSKKPVYVAPILEAGGYTWEREGGRKSPTNIIKDTCEEMKDKAPDTYIRVMASKGIKVHRK